MMSFYSTAGAVHANGLSAHKRHIDEDDDDDHFFKKRLLDNFENLKIFEGSKSVSPIPSGDPINPVVGNSNDTVYIDSIDQFLKDNVDVSELETTPLASADDISKNTIKEIVVPQGLLKPLNDLFSKESQNTSEKFLNDKKRESIDKILSRKRAQQRNSLLKTNSQVLEMDAMLDEGESYKEPEIEVSNEEIYYETYVSEFWSLIKYYNPPMLIFKTAQKWFWERKRKMFYNKNYSDVDLPNRIVYRSPQIEELDEDGDNAIMSDSEVANTTPQVIEVEDVEEDDDVFPIRTSTPTIRRDYGGYFGENGSRIYEVSDNDDDDDDGSFQVNPDERAVFEEDMALDDCDIYENNDNGDSEMELD